MRLFTALLLLLSVQLNGQWDQYFAQWEGLTGSMLVNMGVNEFAPIADEPILMSVGVAFENCTEEGFPDELTYPQLTELSDKLLEYLDIQLTSHLVGTFTHNCERFDYYYIKDTLGVRSFLTNFFSRNGKEFTPLIAFQDDPNWTFYTDFIYPDSYILEYMMNLDVIENLLNNGDDITKVRRIQHWAYFGTEEARDKYRLIVLERGFKEEGKGFYPDYSEGFYYQFSRRDKPELEYISELTLKLQEEAQSLDGFYDGWQCEIVPKKNN